MHPPLQKYKKKKKKKKMGFKGIYSTAKLLHKTSKFQCYTKMSSI